jgi:hypothetical protein
LAEAADGGDRKVSGDLCQVVGGEKPVVGELGDHGRGVAQPARAAGVIYKVQCSGRRRGDPEAAGGGDPLFARHRRDPDADGELQADHRACASSNAPSGCLMLK